MTPWSSPGSVPPKHSVSRDSAFTGCRKAWSKCFSCPSVQTSTHISLLLLPMGRTPRWARRWHRLASPLVPAALPQPCALPAGLSRDKRRLRTSTGFYSSSLTSKSTNSLWKKRKKTKNKTNVQATRTVCVSQDGGRAIKLRRRTCVLCRDVV